MKHTKLPLSITGNGLELRDKQGLLVCELNGEMQKYMPELLHAYKNFPALVEALKKVGELVKKAGRTHSWGDFQQISDVTKAVPDAGAGGNITAFCRPSKSSKGMWSPGKRSYGTGYGGGK